MRAFLPLSLVLLSLSTSGCYYSHLASGQFKLVWRRQPIEEAVNDPAHSDEIRDMLKLVEDVRVFAIDLGLRVDQQYTSYVDWPGDRIVTTLVRTRPGSLEAVPHWFPIVGALPYKGYFDQARAEAEAKRLHDEEGFDVCVSPITAYSTLGWFADPVTSPMLTRGPANLVEALFHELVHATAFLADEVDFNESVAHFIGQQAAIRFFEKAEADGVRTLPAAAVVRRTIEDRRLIALTILAFRERLVEIEGAPNHALRRAEAEAITRGELAELPLAALDAKRVAIRSRLSNACLALQGTYVLDLPRHAAVYEALEGDLNAMIARLADWAEAERPVEGFYRVDDQPIRGKSAQK